MYYRKINLANQPQTEMSVEVLVFTARC